MTARRIRQARRRIRLARVVSAWNGFVAALLLAVLLTALVLSGYSPSLPVMALFYAVPLALILLAFAGHWTLTPRHAASRLHG